MHSSRREFLATAAASAVLLIAAPAHVLAANAPGVTDTEIRIGQTLPLSGPAAGFSVGMKAAKAYFDKINEEGGINGRKINLIQLDDAFSPPKTVEQTRKLVEQEQVAFIMYSGGTAPSLVVRKYLNARKVPQLFVGSGAATWAEDIDQFPWSRGWQPLNRDEGKAYADYIMKTRPDAKIAVLYQNDDAGKDFFKGFADALGENRSHIVQVETNELSDPTVDSQVVKLQASGADVFVTWGSPKATAQSIRKAYDIGWRPLVFINQNTTSVEEVMKSAGLEKAKGVMSVAYLKDPTNPTWAEDPDVKEWMTFMAKYYPGAPMDAGGAYGTSVAQTIVQVLRQCGDDLSRENIMRQTMNLDMELPLLLPGIRLKTTESDRHPLSQFRLQQFDGARWNLLAES